MIERKFKKCLMKKVLGDLIKKKKNNGVEYKIQLNMVVNFISTNGTGEILFIQEKFFFTGEIYFLCEE